MVEIIKSKNKKEIIMRAYARNCWIKMSLEGDCDGINPGDVFVSPKDKTKSMIIGFEGGLVWAIKKGENRIGCFSTEGETIKIIKKSLTKAKNPMTAKTAVEIIDNF